MLYARPVTKKEPTTECNGEGAKGSEAKGLPIYKDYDSTWRIDGYPEFSFSTEQDAKAGAQVCVHYFIDRYSQEMASESRRRRAAGKHKEQA